MVKRDCPVASSLAIPSTLLRGHSGHDVTNRPGVFTLFTLFTLFFDSAGWLIECKNSFVKVRGFDLRG